MSINRRAVLGAATALLSGALAGCVGDDSSRQPFATPAPESGMSDNPTVTLGTNHGDITIELFEERAPRTVENFLNLAGFARLGVLPRRRPRRRVVVRGGVVGRQSEEVLHGPRGAVGEQFDPDVALRGVEDDLGVVGS